MIDFEIKTTVWLAYLIKVLQRFEEDEWAAEKEVERNLEYDDEQESGDFVSQAQEATETKKILMDILANSSDLNEGDLWTALSKRKQAGLVLGLALKNAREEFNPYARGITPELIGEWIRYYQNRIGHPRSDIAEFLQMRAAELAVNRFNAFCRGEDTPTKSNEEQAGEPAAGNGATDRRFIGWRGTPEQLKELADQLQAQGCIERSQWFVERFSSDCPPDVDGWEGQANHIVYLLERLQERKLLVHVPQSRLERVFRIKGYKSKKDGYGRNGSEKPTKADEMDRILSSVFPDS